MAKLENLTQEKILHAVRSDGTKMIAWKVRDEANGPVWEVLTTNQDGLVSTDGLIISKADGEQSLSHRVVDAETLKKIAAEGDYVEWQSGFGKEREDEQQNIWDEKEKHIDEKLKAVQKSIDEQKEQMESTLEDAKVRIDALVTSAKRSISARIGHIPRITPEEVEQQITSTAAEIAQRTPSHTQKVIAYQVQLSGGYYTQVGAQSQLSFRLSCWLVIVGAILFAASMIAVIFPFASGNTSLIGTLGILASVLVETVAGLSFLYNKASQQLAAFQVYLDRINRASICHAMTDEFEKKTKEQQELITLIIQSLISDK